MGQIRIIVPQDVKDVAGYVERALFSLDQFSAACMTLSLATLTDYNNASIAVRTWLTSVAGVGWLTSDLSLLYDAGQRHAQTLRGFYDRFASEGCHIPGGTPTPPKPAYLSSDNPALIPQGLFGNDVGLVAMLLVALFVFQARK